VERPGGRKLPAWWPWLVLVGAVGIALALGFYRLGVRPFWYDEAFSHNVARLGGSRLLTTIFRGDPSMGLYYLLLHGWLALGDGEAAIRSFSVLAGAATVPFVFLLGRKLFDTPTALIASILLPLNGFFVEQSQEARGYTLVMLLATISTLLFVRAIEKQEARWWFSYGAVAGLSVFAHAFALWVIVAQALCSLFLGDPSARAKTIRRFGAILALGLVVAIPIIRVVFGSERYGFIGLPRSDDVAAQIAVLLGHHSWFLLLALFLVCLAAARFFRAIYDKEPDVQRNYGIVLLWFFVPLIGSLLGSFIKPMFAPRFLTPCLPAFVLLVAAGISQVKHKGAVGMLVALLATTSFMGALRWFEDPAARKNLPWREASSYVMSRGRDGDAVVFDGAASATPFTYYRLTADDPPTFTYPYLPPTSNDGQAEARIDDGLEAFRTMSPQPKRVWLIVSSGGFKDAILGVLDASYRLEDDHNFDLLDVRLYELGVAPSE
jgi:mannosyltransferase